jgi:hypothetical protein
MDVSQMNLDHFCDVHTVHTLFINLISLYQMSLLTNHTFPQQRSKFGNKISHKFAILLMKFFKTCQYTVSSYEILVFTL